MQPRARSGSTKASLHRDTAAYLVPVAKKDARNEREGGGRETGEGEWRSTQNAPRPELGEVGRLVELVKERGARLLVLRRVALGFAHLVELAKRSGGILAKRSENAHLRGASARVREAERR